MFSIISTAFSYLLLLIIVVTPVGQWLLLSSAFWTMGMEIIFYFVDNNYPDKAVAVVSAVVAILFVCIVRVIWNVLPPLVDLPSDDKAVCAARPVASAAAGKYGMSHRDLLVESASSFSSSVSGSRSNHTLHEYRDPVGGSTLVVARPSWIMPETDAVFASLSSDRLRMPEVEKKAYSEHAKNVVNASHCVSRFLPVDKQFVAVPSPAAVADASADASWRSDLAESNNVSLSSVSRSTGVSDSGFVASASNATEMTKAVDAAVSCSSVAGADPSGDGAGSQSATACFGAEDGVAAASGGDDTRAGAASDGDAFLEGGSSILDAVPSGIAVCRASATSLVPPVARTSACTTRRSGVGMKRCSDWEFALFAHQEHAKKYKVAPVCDSFSLPAPMEDVATASASEPMEICPPSPVLMNLGFSSVEPMEVCPTSPSPMDLASPAVKPMDLDCDEDMDHILDDSVPFAREASPMDITADGFFSFGLLATTVLSAAPNAALTPTTAVATAAAPPTSSTAAITRCIAYPRACSALRCRVDRNAAQQLQASASTTTTSTTSHLAIAAITTATTIATTATTAIIAATTANETSTAADTTDYTSFAAKAASTTENGNSSGKNNKNDNGNQVENTTSTTRAQLEEFDLNPADILDANEYPVENFEYDEFEGYDFTEGLDLADRLG